MAKRLTITEDANPDVEIIMLATLDALKALGGSGRVQEIDDKIAELEELSDEELSMVTTHSTPLPKFKYFSGWARTTLKHGGMLNTSGRGTWSLTEAGKNATDIESLKEIKRSYHKSLAENRENSGTGQTTVVTTTLEVLAKVVRTDESGKTYGMSYADALKEVRKVHPGQSSINSLRYYRSHVLSQKPGFEGHSVPDFVERSSSGVAIASIEEKTTDTVNLVLYGPPGTSKTFDAIFEAVKICVGTFEANQLDDLGRDAVVEKYKELSDQGRIEFVTFHQSFSYEEFVEGLRPTTESENSASSEATGGFKLEPHAGVFLRISNKARKSTVPENLDSSRQIFQSAVNFPWSPDDSIQKCLDNSKIQFEWAPEVNWTDTRSETIEDFKAAWEQKVDVKMANRTGSMRQTFNFLFGMQEGDYVVLADGREKFVAVGEVTGSYYFDANETSAPHCREVKWMWIDPEGRDRADIYPVHFQHYALYKLHPAKIDWDALDRIVYEQNSPDETEPPPNFVLIIDEINRANISKVFGELITLLEVDKRIGAENEIQVRLPYSNKKFGVPQNLHIIGTMNTADRSIALLDTALRRRFKFRELMPEPELVPEIELGNTSLREVFAKINKRIEYLYDREHQLGHAYFMNCESESDIEDVFRNNVIPLLAEYFYEDRGKIARVLGDYPVNDESPQDGCFFAAEQIEPGKLGIEEQDSSSEPMLQWKIKSKFDFSKLK